MPMRTVWETWEWFWRNFFEQHVEIIVTGQEGMMQMATGAFGL